MRWWWEDASTQADMEDCVASMDTDGPGDDLLTDEELPPLYEYDEGEYFNEED